MLYYVLLSCVAYAEHILVVRLVKRRQLIQIMGILYSAPLVTQSARVYISYQRSGYSYQLETLPINCLKADTA